MPGMTIIKAILVDLESKFVHTFFECFKFYIDERRYRAGMNWF